MITKSNLHLSLMILLIYLLTSCSTSALSTTATATRSATATIQSTHYQINCPPVDTVRAAVMQQHANGTHQAVVYLSNIRKYPEAFGDNGGMSKYKGSLDIYDVSKQQDISVLTIPHARIQEAHLSYDRQWVLFIKDTGSQLVLQMVRTDGQDLQTLYCTSGVAKNPVLWSPDQKYVIFYEQSKNFSLKLLNVKTGSITNLQQGPDPVAAPLLWLDNTHLYLDYGLQPGLDDVKLLDISKGANQPGLPVMTIFHQPTNRPFFDLAITRERTQLFSSTWNDCAVRGEPQPCIPGHITVQSIASKAQKVIYSSSKLMIGSIQVVSNKSLLFTTDNAGLWRIDQNGQNLKQLIRNTPNLFTISDLVHDNSNVSPDGTLYAVLINKFTDNSLEIGSLTGGLPTIVRSEKSNQNDEGNSSDIVGWTTQ